jgi:hypothetical protein
MLILRFLIIRCIEKKSVFIFQKNSRSLFPLVFLLHGLGDVIFAILKVGTENSSVGIDLPITIVAFFNPFFFLVGLVMYFMVIIKFLDGYARMMSPSSRAKVEKRSSIFKRFVTLIIPLNFVFAILPVIGVKYTKYAEAFAITYLAGLGLIVFFFCAIFNITIGFLMTELDSHMKNSSHSSMNDIKPIYSRLRAAYYVGTSLTATVGTSYVIFGVWQYLRIKSDYLFLLVQITIHPVATVLILTVSHISHPNQVSPLNRVMTEVIYIKA